MATFRTSGPSPLSSLAHTGSRLAVALLIVTAFAAATAGSAEKLQVRRFDHNPIIRPEMLAGSDGDNINGPSLIGVPAWITNRLGNYYLYFAHHSGKYIRLAYADRLEGPWHVYQPGTLQLTEAAGCKGHVASPDVQVDEQRKEIRMYFHGPAKAGPGQKTFVAVSGDGLHFKAADEPLGIFYWRVFRWDGWWYAMAKGGLLYRSRDGLKNFAEGPNPFPGSELRDPEYNRPGPRHVALHPSGNRLWIYYSNIGDAPERILRCHLDLTGDWKAWKTSEPEEVMQPETLWEGVGLPPTKSAAGAIKGREHALRDPAIFVEHGRVYLLYAVAGESGIAIAELAQPSDFPKPNILYILADDMGIGDVSCLNPQSAWQTPNLDRLAGQGIRFTDAHSASGVCTPSRYALLTGRYSWRGPLKQGVLHGYDPSLIEPGRLTVPALLRAHGYDTAMIGKWHLGLDWTQKAPKPAEVDFTKPFGGGPTAHGFDRFFGIAASLDMPPYVYLENDRALNLPTAVIADSPHPRMWRAGLISPDFHHQDVQPRFTERALAYLAERAAARDGKPFFLYLAFSSPHTPIIPTQPFEGKTRTNPYGDFVVQIDASVGQLLAALDSQGFATNTLVIFTADNGCAPAANFQELRKFHHDPSAGFRGHKADLFEGGHRVPFIARWPGHTPAGTRCAQTIGQLDLLATCADLLGVRLPDSAGEDSLSILPLLCGQEMASPRRQALVHQSSNGSFAIRQDNWKLCLCPDSGGWSFPRPGRGEADGLPRFQLYDLDADPAEKNNLEATHPEIVQRLGSLMRDYIQRGRSTPGSPQPYDSKTPWRQTAWMEGFPKGRSAPENKIFLQP